MKKVNNKNFAFSLIETMVAISVITGAILVVAAFVVNNLNLVSHSKSRLIAVYLAQEGIEIVKNIRDSNFLEIYNFGQDTGGPWSDGLLGSCGGDFIADFKTPEQQDPTLICYANQKLKINSQGFYNNIEGEDTIFKRKISVSQISDEQLMVVSRVEWQEKGKSFHVEVVTYLFKWYKPTSS